MKKYLWLICAALLNACSTLPSAIKDAPLYDISYSQAIQNALQYKNAPVRWGGVVIDVENEQNYSLVQVMSYPLGSYGRPRLDNANEGRFIIRSPEFLDPAIYKKDSEITVAGTLQEPVERKVGNKTLLLPMVSAAVIHQWPAYVRGNYYGGYGYGGFGYGYPYYGYYGFRPYYWGGYYWGAPY
jgi:outer membrane lipoprotein